METAAGRDRNDRPPRGECGRTGRRHLAPGELAIVAVVAHRQDRTHAAKGGAVTLVSAWQNHIDYLPDPTRDGAMGQGLVGQLFVFDPYDQPAS